MLVERALYNSHTSVRHIAINMSLFIILAHIGRSNIQYNCFSPHRHLKVKWVSTHTG